MRAWLVVTAFAMLSLGCFDKDDNDGQWYKGFRVDAPCSSSQTCPPGQICDATSICRQPCDSPGDRCIPNRRCSCVVGHECDTDGLCRPTCTALPGTGVPASAPKCGDAPITGSCAANLFCDPTTNICRPRCPNLTECSASSMCVGVANGCHLCQPRAGSTPTPGPRG